VTESRPLVAVVDDDESVRESLPDLLAELGFAPVAFASAGEFLSSDALLQTRCLILDISMPGMSGPDLQRELLARGHTIPVIFITAQISQNVRSNLLQRGAAACLFKPFSEKELQDALAAALAVS
jgi:FixJ family two-component response regulator